MISRILVPLDGSPLAETALPYAKQLAAALDVPVRLLRVSEPLRGEAKLLPGIAQGPDEAVATRAAEQYLASVKQWLLPLQDRVVAEHATGVPAVEIIAAAQDRPETLTVMSTHGRSGVARWLLGSVAAKVLHFGSGPVLLLHPAPHNTSSSAPALKALVVPLDGSPRAEQVLLEALPLARSLNLDVTLVQATPTLADYTKWSGGEAVSPDYVTVMEDADKEADRYLAQMAAELKLELGLGTVQTLRKHGDAAELILEAAQAEGTLIAMTTHGRTGFGRAVLGSVADRVVRHGRAPLLLVRAAPDDVGSTAYVQAPLALAR